MKKIINVLALASLTLGIASADAKFSLNYKTQMAAFSRVMTDATDTTGSLYRSHMFNHYGYGNSTDTFKISVSNDIAGANFRIDPTVSYDATNGYQSNFGGDDFGKLKEYNGYITIGNLTVSAGLFSDKLVGKYQLKADHDASNLNGESFAAYKLGSIFTKAITTQADDITSFKGTQGVSGILTYAAKFDGLTLTADLAAVGLNGGSFGTGSTDVMSGFAARLDAKLDSVDTQFVFKQRQNNERSIALHIQPTFGNLTLTLGGALGFANGNLEEYNADLRLYFKAGALSVTSMNNISAISGDVASGDSRIQYATHVGAVYSDAQGKFKSVNNTASRRAMWNVIAFRLEATEKVALLLQAGDIIGFKSAEGKFSDDFGIEAFVAPGLQFNAGKGASITTCARFGFSHTFLNSDKVADGGKGTWGEDRGEMALFVPVVLRVKL